LIFSGKIACANVLSDLYAMGVTECDNMLMLLAVSTKMTEKERDVVIPLVKYSPYNFRVGLLSKTSPTIKCYVQLIRHLFERGV
jgi:hypothetical protein